MLRIAQLYVMFLIFTGVPRKSFLYNFLVLHGIFLSLA